MVIWHKYEGTCLKITKSDCNIELFLQSQELRDKKLENQFKITRQINLSRQKSNLTDKENKERKEK